VYEEFDRSRLLIKPLAEREHDLRVDSLVWPSEARATLESPMIRELAQHVLTAAGVRRATGGQQGAVILIMGAHVLRRGVGPLIAELLARGLISHVAFNGAGPIHEWELARIGATTESVARYIRTGEFGLWRETGELNEVIRRAAAEGLGLGEAVGRAIEQSRWPWKHASVLAAAYRHRIPATVHVGIGYDIIHQHPNCDGAALGATSYRDFLRLAASVMRLEHGVLICAGTAVMGPEVYLKALAMARNVLHQEGRQLRRFVTAVVDIQPLPEGRLQAEPPRHDPRYYFRPWKTVLVRTVADGGVGMYIRGDHRDVFSALYVACTQGIHSQSAGQGAG